MCTSIILVFNFYLIERLENQPKSMATENLDQCFEVAVKLIENAGKVLLIHNVPLRV